MTTRRDADELLVAYLADGMRVLPDGLADAVMDEVHRTRQRTVLGPRRSPVMARFALGAAAAVAVLVLGGGLLLAQRGDTGPGGPTPNPALSPSPSLPAVIGPTTEPAASEPAGPSAGPTSPTGARPTGFWLQTGTMGAARDGRNAVRLVDGRVLVAGGFTRGGEVVLTSAELYDPVTGTWTPTGSMLNPAGGFPATLLRDGTVLISDYRDDGTEDGPRTYGAEVYDPVDGTWTATGNRTTGVGGADRATVLQDGRVLITGQDGAELYDPASRTWTATATMTTPRHEHAAVLLPDGKVLVAGGDVHDDALDSAELYDPPTGSWNAIASMNARRDYATAILLPNGRVLVYGGILGGSASAALYDPESGTWTPSGELASTDGDSYRGGLTLLLDGTVLLAGGPGQGDGANRTALIYDPNVGSWRQTEDMLPRSSWAGSYTLLLDGTVLASGGFEGASQLYIPAGVAPPANLAPIPDPTPSPVPTPTPTPYPPEAGPVPPGARSWTVEVENRSSAPATLFVAEENEHGEMAQLVGRVSPHVVPPRTSMRVTLLLPSIQDGASIFVNPSPTRGGSLLATNEAPLFGRFYVSEDGQVGWVGR